MYFSGLAEVDISYPAQAHLSSAAQAHLAHLGLGSNAGPSEAHHAVMAQAHQHSSSP